jgi:Sec-independent protein translocase protein TatA
MLWIWIAVVVIALVIMGVAAVRLLGRLGALNRAAGKLRHRQAEAMALRDVAEELQRTVADLEHRATGLTRNRK